MNKAAWFLVSLVAFVAMAAQAETVDFNQASPGALPAGWVAGVTGEGAAKWAVTREKGWLTKYNVLKQSGEYASHSYPWCVDTNAILKDGHIEVRFKPLSGKEDQAGGLIWRWQDGDNYYVARANANENNLTIYHTLKGVRTEFKRTPAKVASNKWHRLRVDFNGSHFTVTFDGKKALEWDDDTFPNAGAVGVWTKADSVTEFDDFNYHGK